MKRTALLVPLLLALSACAAVEPVSSPADAPAAKTSIPYPAPDMQRQIDNLGIQVARLENQIESLQTRIQQLERQNTPVPQPRRTTTVIPKTTATPNTRATTASAAAGSHYNQAFQQYRSGNYTAAINLLRNADTSANGGENARKSMYLLLQSHLRLANCESVINIGNRYANNFRSSATAPEALYNVAQCQYRMQQRDIARDTWRKLIQVYPDSAAAKRAYRQLNAR